LGKIEISIVVSATQKSKIHTMTDIALSSPTSLPPRLDGFLKALMAISDFNHPMGGLTIEFPAPGQETSTETLERGDRQSVATFLERALPYGASRYPVAGRQSPAEALIEIIESEFDTPKLEFWYKNVRGANATLLVGINNMAQEHWLELFWAMY
jgi:hypothetical protein